MQFITDGRRSTNITGIVLTTFAVVIMAGFVWGNRFDSQSSEQKLLEGTYHQCLVPAFNATAAFSCEAEAAAYANALHHLEVAQKNADEAYAAWYQCEYGTPPPDDPPEPPPTLPQNTVSILER